MLLTRTEEIDPLVWRETVQKKKKVISVKPVNFHSAINQSTDRFQRYRFHHVASLTTRIYLKNQQNSPRVVFVMASSNMFFPIFDIRHDKLFCIAIFRFPYEKSHIELLHF